MLEEKLSRNKGQTLLGMQPGRLTACDTEAIGEMELQSRHYARKTPIARRVNRFVVKYRRHACISDPDRGRAGNSSSGIPLVVRGAGVRRAPANVESAK